MSQPFEFKQCVTLLKSAGAKAHTLRELRDLIATVSDQVIIHHTYQYFLKGHIQEYTNDFAQWAGSGLEERSLGEHLSNIDAYRHETVDSLRKEIIRIVDDYLDKFPEPRASIPGDEFFFNEAVTIIFPAGIRVKNLAEFLIAVKYADVSSIYYHFYEARMRLGGNQEDFSAWCERIDKKELADRIRAIDPFMHSVEGIREQILQAVEAEVKKDMELAEVIS